MTFQIQHPQGKKRKRDTNYWPVISRETYFSWLEDTEKQIESTKFLLDEGLETVASFIDIEGIDIQDNKELLTTHARTLLPEEKFLNLEKELKTQENFYNYLKKNEPEPLVPSLSLSEFMDYLTQKTDYKISEKNKQEVEEYLTEYYFPK